MIASNNGVLIKATDAKKANEQGTDADKVRLATQAALIDGEGTINIADTTGTAKGSLKKALIEEFGSVSPVVTEYSAGKVTVGEKKYSVTTTGTVAEIKAQWTLTTDNNSNGEPDVGDLLTPTVDGLSNEKFYVIADDGTTLTLLAERCISTSTEAQVNSGYSTVAFDSSTNVYSNNSSIRELVKNYVDTLTGLDLEEVEEVYGGTAVSGRKGRLMWYEEMEQLESTYSDMIYGPSTARIDYWLGSPDMFDFDPGVAMDIYNGGVCGSAISGSNGLRPVIKILKPND